VSRAKQAQPSRGIAGRVYLDPGDRLSGQFAQPRPCTVLNGWGRTRTTAAAGVHWLTPPPGAPRNAAVRYHDDGTTAVVPFTRRLRVAGGSESSGQGRCG
jgi:hypothetical protein